MPVIYRKRLTSKSNHVNKKPKKIWVVKKNPHAEDYLLPFNQEQEELAQQQIQEFADRLKFAERLPAHEKPPRESWKLDRDDRKKFWALHKYALGDFPYDNEHELEQEMMAVRILQAMGFVGFMTYSMAAKVLINIGYYSFHVNLDLIRLRFYPYNDEDKEISTEVNRILNLDNKKKDTQRKDMTGVNAYAIDPEGAEELDDALSVTRRTDGRIQVWIHIADPSNLVKPNSILDKHAMDRGTTVFLPTGSYPMFPQKLAMEGMSLRHGECCNAISVSVVLNDDGSIAEYSVYISTIKPTMLTYMDAAGLLAMDSVEEQTMDLQLLLEAANERLNWRMKHGADTREFIHDARVKVTNVDDPEPLIKIYKEDHEKTRSAHRLVTEMMYLCGEVIASFGSRNDIPLPYRVPGRFTYWPEPHKDLGLIHGYVQVTSPIRRYMDLVAHYQVKSFLAGQEPLITACNVLLIGGYANKRMDDASYLQRKSTRYWMIEYLRRRQTEGETFTAKVIRFIYDSESTAQILLMDLGFKHVADVPTCVEEGDMIKVEVKNANPRDQLLTFKVVHHY